MLSPEDHEVVAAQIGREPHAGAEVVSRCHLDLPVVIRVPPILRDGSPFPTLYWLTCPLMTTRIGRLEAAGGVRRMEGRASADPLFKVALVEANQEYAREREALVPEDAGISPRGGVGGSQGGVKCLHAHYAHTRAGGDNPVGRLVADWGEPLDCAEPCVEGGERNPDWVNRP
ncbi:MAG: DUF501 domain-containing protein [Actinobacteria bacterium]|nr:DUF501 domain-containing protein [Actinomycetota bacterium]